jgi:pimeloyl-ACP methyl ester carboxylesterase
MFTIPEDEQEQLEQFLIRSQHLATAGKFLWPIPDKGLKKRIHRIKAPTHIVWGQSDGLTPAVYAQEFQKHIPGAEVTLLQRCAHLPMYEDMEGFVNAVAGFLTRSL